MHKHHSVSVRAVTCSCLTCLIMDGSPRGSTRHRLGPEGSEPPSKVTVYNSCRKVDEMTTERRKATAKETRGYQGDITTERQKITTKRQKMTTKRDKMSTKRRKMNTERHKAATGRHKDIKETKQLQRQKITTSKAQNNYIDWGLLSHHPSVCVMNCKHTVWNIKLNISVFSPLSSRASVHLRTRRRAGEDRLSHGVSIPRPSSRCSSFVRSFCSRALKLPRSKLP